MRSGPRARSASCPDLITFNRHLKLDLGPTIHRYLPHFHFSQPASAHWVCSAGAGKRKRKRL
jgi:hypothetical protein